MRIGVTGSTGFIGRTLVLRLLGAGHAVTAFSRSTGRARKILPSSAKILPWKPEDLGELSSGLDGLEAVVNLAGENIGAGRWTQERKGAILNSRVHAGRSLALAFTQVRKKPMAFIQGSAVGYYGNRGDHGLEESDPAGSGFLADVVRQSEASVGDLPGMGIRTVILRFGVVLGADGGALPRMTRPFKLHAGGVPGNGKQWVSWVHREDALSAILHGLENPALKGIYNVCAPGMLQAGEFYGILGKVLKRRCWMPMPARLLDLVLGEMAEELILWGQKVHSDRLEETGFKFAHPELEAALRQILDNGKSKGGRPS